MIKTILIFALIWLIILYITPMILAVVNALLTRPNYKFPISHYFKTFWWFYKFAGWRAKWKGTEMIWILIRDIQQSLSPGYKLEMARRDAATQKQIDLIEQMPGTLILLYKTRLLELPEFSNFKHNLVWVIPSLFGTRDDDYLREQCPFILTKEQYNAALKLYLEVSAQVIEHMNAKSDNKVVQFLDWALDNPVVWASYKELGIGKWDPANAATLRWYELEARESNEEDEDNG